MTDEFAGFKPAPSTDSDEFADFLPAPNKPKETKAPDDTWLGEIKGDADAAAALASGAIVGRTAALARTFNRVLPEWMGGEGSKKATEADINKTEQALTYEPKTPEGRYALEKIGAITHPIAETARRLTGAVIGDENVPAVSDALAALSYPGVRDLVTAPFKATRSAVQVLKAARAPAVEDALKAAYANQSMGAAAAAPDLSKASAPLQQAFRNAVQEKGAINPVAAANHLEADQHGIQLMEGQATRDPIQFSNEQNSTHPAIVKRINDQNQQMVDAIDNVRREAAPGSVQNNPIENGQIAIDSLKAYDEPIKADINAKYDAARKASADGQLMMDGSTFIEDANKGLKPQSKFRFLPATVKGILDDVAEAKGQMTLDDFQAYETQLGNEIAKAKAAGDGNAMVAIGKVKDALEKVKPIGDETAEAKKLFDQARASAKARFEALDADPAYEAAVEDLSLNGIKKGKPSALADRFLDKYALQAPKANIARLMEKLDPEAQQAVASHALGAIRKAAVSPNNTVSPHGFNSAIAKYEPKLDVLLTPETRESLDSLGRVITSAKVPPPGHFVNYSKSGVIRNAATDTGQVIGEHVLNAKTFGMGVPVVKGLIENNFAKRALAPGAGLNKVERASDIARATGGKVDHEALVNRLMNRWKSAKKATDQSTEPLLRVPDATVIRALEVAQKHI